MQWTVILALGFVALAANAQINTREQTEAAIDLYFGDVDGAPGLPASLTYHVVNTESLLELVTPTTIEPSDYPCPGQPEGCVRVTIPAERMLIVGLCEGSAARPIPCRTAADCPLYAPCRASTGAYQDHALVLWWSNAHDEVTLHTRNLPHVYPPTLTPSQAPPATAAATPTTP